MSDELIGQWQDRVYEAETELHVVQEDIDAVLQERKALRLAIRRYEDAIEAEKRNLLTRLEAVELQAKDLGQRCESTVEAKDRVEAVYIKTLDDYEAMHFVVRDIKTAEEELQRRDDVDARLQRESLAWAEEEHGLRTSLGQLQQQLKQTRRQQQVEVQELESQLATLERRQQRERAERQSGSAEQPASEGLRSSCSRRRPPPPPSSGISTRMTGPHATSAEEGQLRSCLKSTGSIAPPSTTAADHISNSTRAPTAATAAASAPVSRCTSQPLVSDSMSVVQQADGSSASSRIAAASPPSLQLLQQMRAKSSTTSKYSSQKRELFGDATNRQT